MARIDLIDEADHPELEELVGRIKQGRRGSLINVYRLLLNNPALAETWFQHLNAVRWKTGLSGRLREILIIRIGWMLEIAYIMRQHIPKLALADGLDEADCAALQEETPSARFSEAERAAMAYCEAMTREVHVSDDVFAELARFYAPAEILDITVLVGTYNMHARVLAALDLDLEPAP